jgi:hypothetical protein
MFGCYCLDVTVWMLLPGCYCLDVTIWMLLLGCYCLNVTVWMLLFGSRSSSNRLLPVPSLLHVLYPREGSVPWGQSSARAVGRAGDELQDASQSSGSDVITDSGKIRLRTARCSSTDVPRSEITQVQLFLERRIVK